MTVATKHVQVTAAAKLIVERNAARQQPTPEAIQTIASARRVETVGDSRRREAGSK